MNPPELLPNREEPPKIDGPALLPSLALKEKLNNPPDGLISSFLPSDSAGTVDEKSPPLSYNFPFDDVFSSVDGIERFAMRILNLVIKRYKYYFLA